MDNQFSMYHLNGLSHTHAHTFCFDTHVWTQGRKQKANNHKVWHTYTLACTPTNCHTYRCCHMHACARTHTHSLHDTLFTTHMHVQSKNTYLFICTMHYTCTHTDSLACMHMHLHTHTHSQARTHTPTLMHARTHVHSCTRTHMYSHACTYTHTPVLCKHTNSLYRATSISL